MKIDINPQNYSNGNCFDSVIYNICIYFDRNINPYFLSSFGFEYYENTKNEDMLNKLFIWHNDCNGDYLLSKFCGISIKYENNIYNAKDTIKAQIDQLIPIEIEMDSYHIPWNKYYHQFNRRHFFLIIGYTDEDYICFDSYLNQAESFFNKSQLHNHVSRLLMFEKHDYTDDLLSVVEFLKKDLNQKKFSHINDLKKLAIDIAQLKFSDIEKDKNYDIGKSDFIFGLNNLYWSREHFINALLYFSQKYKSDIFCDIIIDLSIIKDKWKKAKDTFIKSYFVIYETKQLNILSTLFFEIADMEEKIINKILKINLLEGNSNE
jgi:hypothetical protein